MMKAAVLKAPRDIRIEMLQTPSIRSDEVLLKVMACGVCGTDVHAYKNGRVLRSLGRPILGHEFSGEVIKVGETVQGVNEGDRVIGTGYRHCGNCHRCQRGQVEWCSQPLVPGEGLDGAFAEYVVVPRPAIGKTVFRVPDGLSWEEAATIEPVAVACYAVARARIQSEEIVVILGAGMIGQCIAQVCRTIGARTIVSEPSPIRLAMARSSGVDITLDPVETDPVEAVAMATSGDMASVVFECSGSPVAFRQAVEIARPFGKIIQVGLFEGTLELLPDLTGNMFAFKNLTIRGSGGQRWDMAVDLVGKRQVKTHNLITHRFRLDDIKEAFETQLDSNKAIKVIVHP